MWMCDELASSECFYFSASSRPRRGLLSTQRVKTWREEKRKFRISFNVISDFYFFFCVVYVVCSRAPLTCMRRTRPRLNEILTCLWNFDQFGRAEQRQQKINSRQAWEFPMDFNFSCEKNFFSSSHLSSCTNIFHSIFTLVGVVRGGFIAEWLGSKKFMRNLPLRLLNAS